MEEVGRRRMCIGTYRRAIKFDTKMARCEEGSMRRECWKKWAEKRGLGSGMGKDREEFLETFGWTKDWWRYAIQYLEEPWRELEEDSIEKEWEDGRKRLSESRYLAEQRT